MGAIKWWALVLLANACGSRTGLDVSIRDAPDSAPECPPSNEPERLIVTPDVVPDGIVAVGGWLYFGGAYPRRFERG